MSDKKYPNGKHPNSLKNLVRAWDSESAKEAQLKGAAAADRAAAPFNWASLALSPSQARRRFLRELGCFPLGYFLSDILSSLGSAAIAGVAIKDNILFRVCLLYTSDAADE